MRGRDVVKTINERVGREHRFVRWWRNEEDFLDYDLIDRFVVNHSDSEEIGGLELLTMEEMWGELKRVGGERVKLVHSDTGETVEWLHKGKSGVHRDVCPYTAETLMTIFDVETHGNPVDS